MFKYDRAKWCFILKSVNTGNLILQNETYVVPYVLFQIRVMLIQLAVKYFFQKSIFFPCNEETVILVYPCEKISKTDSNSKFSSMNECYIIAIYEENYVALTYG